MRRQRLSFNDKLTAFLFLRLSLPLPAAWRLRSKPWPVTRVRMLTYREMVFLRSGTILMFAKIGVSNTARIEPKITRYSISMQSAILKEMRVATTPIIPTATSQCFHTSDRNAELLCANRGSRSLRHQHSATRLFLCQPVSSVIQASHREPRSTRENQCPNSKTSPNGSLGVHQSLAGCRVCVCVSPQK